jgi:hypothetical protein
MPPLSPGKNAIIAAARMAIAAILHAVSNLYMARRTCKDVVGRTGLA